MLIRKTQLACLLLICVALAAAPSARAAGPARLVKDLLPGPNALGQPPRQPARRFGPLSALVAEAGEPLLKIDRIAAKPLLGEQHRKFGRCERLTTMAASRGGKASSRTTFPSAVIRPSESSAPSETSKFLASAIADAGGWSRKDNFSGPETPQ